MFHNGKRWEVKGYFNLFQKTIKFCTDRPIKLQGPRCFTHKHQLNNSTSQEVEEDEKLKGFHASLADSERGNIPGFPETPGNKCNIQHQMFFNSFYQCNTIVHSITVNPTCELVSPTLIYLSSSHIHIFKTQFSGCS